MTVLAFVAGRGARAPERLLRGRRVRARALAAGAPRGDDARRAPAARRSRCASSTSIDEYLSACQLGITLASLGIGFLGEPAIAKLLEPCSATTLPHGVSLGDLARDRLPDHDVAPHHVRRAGAEDLRDRRGRGHRAPGRAAAAACSASVFRPFIGVLNGASQRGSCGWSASTRRGELDEGGSRPRSSRSLIARVADRRQARPGRGGDAHRRLPPARAAGAPGDDAGAGGRHRRRLRGRRDRAAPLRLVRPHAPGGHRGREPRPREGHRARQRARAAAADRGPGGAHRRARARGADRARDQAARRPARRPPAPAQRRWRS